MQLQWPTCTSRGSKLISLKQKCANLFFTVYGANKEAEQEGNSKQNE